MKEQEITKEQFRRAYPDLYAEIEGLGVQKGKSEAQKQAQPSPEDQEKGLKAMTLIQNFKSLPSAIQESGMSVLDYENLQNLAQSGDAEAKLCLKHWMGSGPSFWGTWENPTTYYGWLQERKKEKGGKSHG